ncbi:hypothetical protein B9T62_21620 [Paenibacillus donghaensis]|uniref:Uncharacterized protein n=1 Tax=Paenibacillus donghaensis TaxID=414771 RepID=A0A2Z2KBP8_9BACL|nr:hypothetical protein B9T62_21620 [Paenibacillus donghaensis]
MHLYGDGNDRSLLNPPLAKGGLFLRNTQELKGKDGLFPRNAQDLIHNKRKSYIDKKRAVCRQLPENK